MSHTLFLLMNINKIINLIILLTFLSSCHNNKKKELAISNYCDVKKDTIEIKQVDITSFIPLDDLDKLHLNINNTSHNVISLSQYCIQISKDKVWETLFCDTLTKIELHPFAKDEVVIDLRIGQYTYNSNQQYRFIAYQINNDTVSLVKHDFYSFNLVKHPKTGKTYLIPDSIIED